MSSSRRPWARLVSSKWVRDLNSSTIKIQSILKKWISKFGRVSRQVPTSMQINALLWLTTATSSCQQTLFLTKSMISMTKLLMNTLIRISSDRSRYSRIYVASRSLILQWLPTMASVEHTSSTISFSSLDLVAHFLSLRTMRISVWPSTSISPTSSRSLTRNSQCLLSSNRARMSRFHLSFVWSMVYLTRSETTHRVWESSWEVSVRNHTRRCRALRK